MKVKKQAFSKAFLIFFPHQFAWNKGLKSFSFCILIPLSFLKKPSAFLERHNAIHLNLDNDKSGIKTLIMPKV